MSIHKQKYVREKENESRLNFTVNLKCFCQCQSRVSKVFQDSFVTVKKWDIFYPIVPIHISLSYTLDHSIYALVTSDKFKNIYSFLINTNKIFQMLARIQFALISFIRLLFFIIVSFEVYCSLSQFQFILCLFSLWSNVKDNGICIWTMG